VHLVGFIIRNLSRCTVTWTSNLHFWCFYSGAVTLMPSTIRYVDSGPESMMPHVDSKRNTVHHPQVVYDMPKSTQVYVAPHHHLGDNEASTPRSSSSDNYRKDFAHGARPGHSLASSDSELSQPATRRVSRHQCHSRYDVLCLKCGRHYSLGDVHWHFALWMCVVNFPIMTFEERSFCGCVIFFCTLKTCSDCLFLFYLWCYGFKC